MIRRDWKLWNGRTAWRADGSLTVCAAAVGLLPLITGCGGPARSGSAPRSASHRVGARFAQRSPQRSPSSFPVTLKDALGVRVTITRPPLRIISLAPSATEILFDIGAGRRVVAVTTQDDYPPQVKRLPRIGDFMSPSAEKILGFRPELVVAARGNSGALLASLQRLKVKVFAVDPRSAAQVEQTVQDLGKLTGFDVGAQKVAERMKRTTQSVQASLRGERPVTGLIEVGHDPLFAAGPGTVASDALRLAGGKNVAPNSPTGYPQLSNESVLALNPASLFIGETGVTLTAVEKRPGWNQLAAVRSGRVFMIDPALISRPAPRIVIAIEEMAKDLHPHAFTPR
ncbi:MAG TPA: ABC transporter substrate-binding protein [Armatimonadota bacterium]|nr:ABC transporter substrate-binding protein [Armatimonadota bacterium]